MPDPAAVTVPTDDEKDDKKTENKWIIALIIILVLLGLGLGGYMLYYKSEKKSTADPYATKIFKNEAGELWEYIPDDQRKRRRVGDEEVDY